MLLITSGAYVESELASEFGRIPPAFLPVGNRRLYTCQVGQFAAQHGQVWLTLPADFVPDEADALWLRARDVRVFRTTPEAPLGAAVHEFLSACVPAGPLDILYGDTLVTDPLREGSDWLAVGHTDEYYDWHHEAPSGGRPGGAWSGLFSFSNAALLREQLAGDAGFIAAVQAYGHAIGGLDHWEVSRWLDFGHVHTYFASKRIITTQRHFNRLRVADGVVTKSGQDSAKILAEAAWFEQAPAPIKPFLAPYICRIDAQAGKEAAAQAGAEENPGAGPDSVPGKPHEAAGTNGHDAGESVREGAHGGADANGDAVLDGIHAIRLGEAAGAGKGARHQPRERERTRTRDDADGTDGAGGAGGGNAAADVNIAHAAHAAGGAAGYQLEYLHLATLNELYVFGRLPEAVWRRIFGACDDYLRAALAVPSTPLAPDAGRETYVDKTLRRLHDYAGQAGVDLDAPWSFNGRRAPSLHAIAGDAGAALLRGQEVPAFLHGDFCFSNILFDFRAGRIKMVDPRGTDALGRPSRFGDLRYDLAKLAHSVLGLYDFIVAGFYLLRSEGQALHFRVLSERCAPVQRLFCSTLFAGRLPVQWQCYPAMVLLFLSMLPLHADDPRRQQALMANGIRLYLEWTSDDRHPHGRTEPALP